MSRATFGVEGNANKFRVKPAMVALCAVLALAGCAKDNKNNLPGNGMAGGAGAFTVVHLQREKIHACAGLGVGDHRG